MGPATVRKANKATASQLLAAISSSEVIKNSKYQFTVAMSSELTVSERKMAWDIFQENMHDLYVNSAFGWDPPSKQEELFDPLSRFILCQKSDDSIEDPETLLAAYTMFRFDREEGEDVAYCYELQVAKNSQNCGLGKALMQKLSNIGSKWGMRKIMLTILKANTSAMKFYLAIGFTVDPTSPEYQSADDDEWVDEDKDEEQEEYDYEILSKYLAAPTT